MPLDTKTIEIFEERFGPISKVVSRLIRPAFIARVDRTLVWGDWSAIEARVLPWLADSPGAEKVLDVFRTNDADKSLPDIYEVEASGIYDLDAAMIHRLRKEGDKEAKDQRQTGKVAILALGFGGGTGALDAMATNYGIHMDYGLQKFIVDRWRANNQWAVTFWKELMDAFNNAHRNPGEIYTAGRVAYVFLPDYLKGTMMCYLPDGRAICYAALRKDKVKREDDVTGEMITEWVLRYQAGYERRKLWHGILAENITQGTAASLLRGTMRRMDADRKQSQWIVGHTHDELITECWETNLDNARVRLKEHMEHVPKWAEGLPLVAEITDNWFYTKTLD